MFYVAKTTLDFLGTYEDGLDALIESANLLCNIDKKQALRDFEELRAALLLSEENQLKDLEIETTQFEPVELRYHTSKLERLGRFWEVESDKQSKQEEASND